MEPRAGNPSISPLKERDLQEGLVVHGIDNKPKLNRSTNIDQEISVIAYGILRPRASKFVVHQRFIKPLEGGYFCLSHSQINIQGMSLRQTECAS